MSDLVKHIAALMPGPANMAKHLRRANLDVIFPFYHAVSNQVLTHTKYLYSLRNLAQFENDLDYLLEYFKPVKMSEFLEGNRSASAHKPPMVLSFDDGLIQCYEEIRPLLVKKGIPATIFLNNDFVDNKAMFFRFKVSLLLESLPYRSEDELEEAAKILHCRVPELRRRLLAVSYLEREIADRVADLWNYSFKEYMRIHPVYLSTDQIGIMREEGFEFGSHGFDHPLFSMLTADSAIDHIRSSVNDLQNRFGLDHKYFAFPFTDHGVKDETIDRLFGEGVIDAGFGTAGLKEDKWPGYFQRVPMEWKGLDARKIVNGELHRRRVRRTIGRNSVIRD